MQGGDPGFPVTCRAKVRKEEIGQAMIMGGYFEGKRKQKDVTTGRQNVSLKEDGTERGSFR